MRLATSHPLTNPTAAESAIAATKMGPMAVSDSALKAVASTATVAMSDATDRSSPAHENDERLAHGHHQQRGCLYQNVTQIGGTHESRLHQGRQRHQHAQKHDQTRLSPRPAHQLRGGTAQPIG